MGMKEESGGNEFFSVLLLSLIPAASTTLYIQQAS